MDETDPLGGLPETYERALRLRAEGLDEMGLAAELGLEPEAVRSVLRIAEAKLARLRQEAEARAEEAGSPRAQRLPVWPAMSTARSTTGACTPSSPTSTASTGGSVLALIFRDLRASPDDAPDAHSSIC